MTVIAMTREMGSLGKEVARLVAGRLDLTIIHHEMVGSAAERSASDAPSAVARFLEVGPDPSGHRNGGLTHNGYLTPADILGLALRGNVLIRGWGAARLLRSVPHILTVRVCAPMERRIDEICRRLGVERRGAKREIERNDAAHARTFLAFFSADWRKPTNYDMVLNTGHLSVESCADILTDAARSSTLAETPESRRILEDRLLQAQIEEKLHDPDVLGHRAAYVQSSVDDGHVRLYGAVGDGGTAREVEAMVGALPGVADIRSEIARVQIYGS